MYALPESCPFTGLFYSKSDLFNNAHPTANYSYDFYPYATRKMWHSVPISI
ncbi:hypothetical protein [Serratia symbiotica]|uniref:hypothetical protein n=1 Tax=Serratia symbiotica TaxID=138074 RepID=UPI0030D62645